MSAIKTLLLICLLFGSLDGHASASGEDESVETKETDEHPIERLAQTVVFIHSPNSDPQTGNAGTGFNIRHNQRWYSVTANHVLAGDLKETRILGNLKHGVAWFPVAKIEEGLPGSTWIRHPTADLAIHPFGPSVVKGFTGTLIFGKTLYEGKHHLLDRLVSIGFPYTVGSNVKGEQLSPVAKETRLVGWPVEPIEPLERLSGNYLFIDPPLYPGFSGAPVYSLDETPGSGPFRERHVTLVGVYVGVQRFGDKERELFLGRVVPVKTLIELLNSDAVKEYEKRSTPIAEPDASPKTGGAP